MSTKTSIKRVALVAVAALGFGMVSTIPAFAANAFTSAGGAATLYTAAGTATSTTVTIVADADTALTGGTVTATMTTSPTGSTAAASFSSTGIEAPFAAGGTANNTHPTTYSGNVATIAADPDGTGVTLGTTAKAIGTLNFTPDAAGKYVITLTLDSAFGSGSETNGTVTIWASGASGTVGTSGTGTKALTATVGGQAQFKYTTPNGTSTGTIYQIQSSGVGSIIGATGLLTDLSTAENPVPYNGTVGDFSAGAKWTTGTNTTPHQATFTLQSSAAGTQTVSITKIDATTGAPVAVTSIAVTWNSGTSLNLTTLQVSTLPGNDAANCTVANKSNAAHNSISQNAASDQTNSAASDIDVCVLALNGNGSAIALSSLTIVASGNGFIGQDAGSTTYGISSTSTDLDGAAQFNLAGTLVSGTAKYSVTAKALNADASTYTTLTGSVSVNWTSSSVASSTLTQSVYALDDDAAATVVAKYSAKDANGFAIVSGSTSNVLVDSDAASTLTVDVAGETDATAAVTVSAQNTVSALGVETSGTISVDCANATYEKLTIWLNFTSDTVSSNKIVVYCTENLTDATAETISFGVENAEAGGEQTVTATVLAGLTSYPTYPVADQASAVSFTTSGGTVVTASAGIENGVATTKLYAPAIDGTYKFTGTAGGASVTKDWTVTGSSSGAALDAANEATDAANAATDAANAAAEAADAATAAAQDAQAAVAALATQVASLIAGIKAQITTLTNLVIKIQKKVKA